MLGRRPYTARAILVQSCAAALMVLGVSHAAWAGSEKDDRAPPLRDVEATASVTLGRLSVGALGADRPWNPRVCIGCELNNGAAYSRLGARRSR